MKVVFTISHLGGGGAERVVALLSGKLAELGHTVSLITLIKHPIIYPLNESIKLIELDCKKSRITGTLEQIKCLRKVFRQEKPDVIISFLPVVNMVALISNLGLKSKIIISERNDPYQNPRKKVIRVLRDLLYHLSDGFVFQTLDAMNYFGEYTFQKGTVIANPLTSNLPNPYEGIRQKRFISAVRLEPQKNLDMLIEAFAKIIKEYPEYSLEIYGEGSQRQYLEKKCIEMNLSESVFLKGFSKNLHSDILKAGAFVLPSNYEGISNSMLEALALGIPVISTDHPIGGAKMFIKNRENGILTKVGNVEEMFQAMKYIIEEPDEVELMAQNATSIRTMISVENIVSQWENYIRKVCE